MKKINLALVIFSVLLGSATSFAQNQENKLENQLNQASKVADRPSSRVDIIASDGKYHLYVDKSITPCFFAADKLQAGSYKCGSYLVVLNKASSDQFKVTVREKNKEIGSSTITVDQPSVPLNQTEGFTTYQKLELSGKLPSQK